MWLRAGLRAGILHPASAASRVVTGGTAGTPWPILQVPFRFGFCCVASVFVPLVAPESGVGIHLESFKKFLSLNRLDFFCFPLPSAPPTLA